MTPCIPIKNGVLCLGGRTTTVTHRGRTWCFEWTSWAGWCPVRADGTGIDPRRVTRAVFGK